MKKLYTFAFLSGLQMFEKKQKNFSNFKTNNYLKLVVLLITMFSTLFSSEIYSQTTLISPTAAGGFELGTSFAANSWTAVNSTTDTWNVGAVPVVDTGANCAYISANGGVAWAYSQLSTIQHLYYDVTIPAGETNAALSFRWKVGGEGTTTSDWDNMKVFIAPISTIPVANTAISSAFQVSGTGAVSGMYKLSSTSWNSSVINALLVGGASYRIIFSWKSDGTDIANPPAALDGVSFVTAAPSTFTSAATGNFSAPATWIGGVVPPNGNNIIIANGTTVTIDTTVSIADVTVGQGASGILAFGATPTLFTVTGNLTVATGGTFNVFQGTTGKSLTVAGNIANNGVIDLSTGTGTTNILTLNGTAVQTIGGTGSFATGVIRNLTFNNTATATTNIIWNFNNVSVGGNLTFTAGKVALGTNRLTLGTGSATGTGALAVGALSVTSGGFTSGKFNRWWAAASTGSSITAGTTASSATSRYPFIDLSPTPLNRSAWIERGTGLAAGQLSCTYNNSPSSSTVSIVADAGYTVETRFDGSWAFSTEGSAYAAATQEVAISAPGIYSAANGNGRIFLAAASAGGTHQNGTNVPQFQRVLSTAQLTAGALFVGAANADLILPCTGTPISGTIPTSTAICSGTASGVSIAAVGFSTATGITFQWEQSTDSGANWANVSGGTGATSTTYTTPILASSIQYRLRSTCTASAGSSITNVSTISVVACTYNTALSNNATFTSIMPANGGSGLAFPGWTSTSSGDDNTSTPVSISGTTFTYQGQPVSGFRACSNGWMTLNTAVTSVQWTNNLTSAAQNQILAPLWDDLCFTGQAYANRDTSLRYLVSGTLGSGSAVITVEWAGIEKFQNPGPNMNFQVKLYEAGNKIEYIYGTMEAFDGTLNSNYSYSIGYNGTNPAGTTANDRFAMQVENTNFFSAAGDPGTMIAMPRCNTMITLTPGTYTGLTAAPAPVVPSNDNVSGAIDLPVSEGPSTSYCGTYYFSTNATNSGVGQACATTAGFEDDDVWFSFTTGEATDYAIRVRGGYGYDAVVQLFDSSMVAVTCTNVVGSNSTSQIETINATGLTQGTQYFVRVFYNGVGSTGLATNRGEFSIAVNSVIAPPTNDNIGGATALVVGTACVTTASQLPNTLVATASPTAGLPACTTAITGTPDDDVWYSFVATANQTTITVQSGAGYNAALNVFASSNGTSTGTLTNVGCLNSTSTAGAEILTGQLTAGLTYFVRVFHAAVGAGTGNFTICVTETLPCSVEYTWDGTIWTPGTPIAAQKIVFTGNYSAAANLTGCSIDIRNGANVIIPAGNSFTTSGAVTVSSGTLTVSSDGNLIQTASATSAVNAGSIAINRNTTMKRLDYTYWSSPVAGQNLLAISPATLPNRFYTYNGTAFVAVAPAATAMDQGTGYSVRAPNTHPATDAPFAATFNGVPNNGNVSVTVPAGQYKFVGNPYPSTVSGNAFLGVNAGTLYFWTHFASSLTAANNNNAAYNLTGGTVAPAGGAIPNGTIQVGQGFMYDNVAATTVSFTNAMRTPSTSTQFFKSATASTDKSRIWLNLVSNNEGIAQTLVAYMPNATVGFDESYDGRQIQKEGTYVSSLIDNQELVIQARPTFNVSDNVKLGFTTATAGTFAFAVDKMDGLFANGQDVYIKDNLLKTTTKINENPYSFVSQVGTFNNRFEMIYRKSGATATNFDANSVIVFENATILNVNASTAFKSVKVYDISGRTIFEKNDINANQTILNGLLPQQQVLLVQVTDAANIVVTKKVIF